MRFFLLAALLSQALPAQHAAEVVLPAKVLGGAPYDGGWLLWGDGLGAWRNGHLRWFNRTSYQAPGCVSGRDVVLLESGGAMIRLRGPAFAKREVLEPQADFTDCLPATLLGREGIVVMHRGMQVRFYSENGYREIYSFYTASYQAGLLFQPVDHDSLPDLIAGNYWIRSPEKFELSWRLFAINTWFDQPQSARIRWAPINVQNQSQYLAAQAGLNPGRIAIFAPAADRTRMWDERLIAIADHPAHVAVHDFNADALEDFAVGEAQRIRVWVQQPGGSFRHHELGEFSTVRGVWADRRQVVALVDRSLIWLPVRFRN